MTHNYIKVLATAIAAICSVQITLACTNIIVGKKASKDGSVFVSYSADSYGAYGVMQHYNASTHKKGDKRIVRDWETNKYLGEIDEAPITYNVVGNINEFQLTIAETTFGGREELVDTTGIIDYGSLIYITLQRAKTAREAIKIMDELVNRYGYCSEGETFSIADPNEAFIMEMVGKAGKERGAVWVAVRIPDEAVCVHANQSRIHQFLKLPKQQVLYSKDVISFARKMKLYEGKDIDFDFAKTYCPLNFDGARYCEARVWTVYNRFAKGMEKYLDYASGNNIDAAPLPLYIYPDRPVSFDDVMSAMGDHYENTPFDMTNDPGAGPYLSPYRPRPLAWKYNEQTYFNERPVGTQQSSFSFISQMRSSLPNPIGGILWFANDDAHTSPYTPVYCCVREVPSCYTLKYGNAVKFSLKSAFWVQNWVSNMVYPRYSQVYPDVKRVIDELHQKHFTAQNNIEITAQDLYKTNPENSIAFLTKYSNRMAEEMMTRWVELGWYLVVKHNDMVEKVDTPDGSFEVASEGADTINAKVKNVGYPQKTRKNIVDLTKDKYLVK
ncbi:MAG: C69 family dipeptidase [Bacteroidaceae bacterium]|nr:C69 family dipeptidase [Prevotellaceae bacterium]MDY2849993.1 C69 family dipeptidase [Bacteroidaceae bacterium]